MGFKKTSCKHGHLLTDENTRQTYNKNGTKNGRICKTCHRIRTKCYAKEDKNGVAYRSRTNFQLRSRYGINSLEERDKLLESQDNKCAICGTSDCSWGKGFQNVWHIDHEHNGPANHRGILCASCNHTLGRLGDSPQFIQKFIDYLKSYAAD